jgi:GT2 family glycosyltransferase
MIDTELFRSLDGFSSTYVRGDYEDSDLCLRLRQRGLQSWYLPHVELYHLEGQSYPSRERDTASRFNRLLHSHRWRETLRAIEGAA